MKNKIIVTFDFDGTLVNTFEDSVIAYNKALEIHNLPIFQYENIEDLNFNDFISPVIILEISVISLSMIFCFSSSIYFKRSDK